MINRQYWILVMLLSFVFVSSGISCAGEIRNEAAIGIKTIGSRFTELIPAGQRLPYTFSEIFGNAEDNQTAIELELAQKYNDTIDLIVAAQINDLPPRPKGTLQVLITIVIDQKKRLTLTATVSEANYVKEFGPFPVR